MELSKYITELLEGRGFFASFLVISGWMYTFVLILVLLVQLTLYLFGVSFKDIRFKIEIQEQYNKKDSSE